MEHIDLRRARELVIDVAEGHEGYVYERRPFVAQWDGYQEKLSVCDYVRDDRPSCIVGHVLARAGVPVEVLKMIDIDETGSAIGAELLAEGNVLDRGATFDVTREAAEFLGRVQNMQDLGETWGACADLARTWGEVAR